MINKQIQIAAWTYDRAAMCLLNTWSKGFDKDQLQKIASDLSLSALSITPKKGCEYVHIITTGAGEFYSANSNADYFNEKSRMFEFPHAKEASDRTGNLKGGLSEYHKTYREFGGVYKHHNNSRKGFAKEGSVVWEQYNEPMHRGEVIAELPVEKWADDLEKIANGEHVPFSMGCSVPQDICSWCHNKAKTRKQYCEHLKFNKLSLDKNGHQCFAINDEPYFHDISRVLVPSEKIALVISKVASQGTSVSMADQFVKENSAGLYLPIGLIEKLASKREANKANLLYKLAELEKQVMTEGDQTLSDARSLSSDEEDDVVKKLEGIPLEQLLSGLTKNNMLLTPNTFVRIVLNKKPADIEGVSGFENALKDVFTDLKDNANPEDVLEDGSYCPHCHCPMSVDNKVKGLSGMLSLDPEPVQKRVIKIIITGKPKGTDKVATTDEPSAGARVLAREYGKYQLSFLASVNKPSNLKMVIAGNYAM